ncbi:MAG: acetyl-CoA carboxylase biotin carboxylase subunit [Afipia sp.]|nr:acetyl-CoA carboxylase biotin carboxylase subunit [Afipia sp.]
MKPTPFRKILIANRGEIALRVMRTAKCLGYGTVAVFSTADAGARHVREADQAVCIGGPLPSESYLCIGAIVDAAKASGADAVHPGYGFLAENADFAQACHDAGLVFIGPSPDAIRTMGHKAGAKQVMAQAGVPCVPGYQGIDQGDATMLAEAKRIRFPVMIKAVAGGGGRGMRFVPDEKSLPDMLRAARSEAQNAFGDPNVILERAIVEPHHIEIQVFGDRYGNAIHLGERDCSVQRRHQKLIEEAPSPAVSDDLRARMGATAVAAVKAIKYEGAGTLEFLLDGAGNYYFMEMNTRLQVEHPVTEAIAGVDLVELQLRIARGETLPLRQQDILFRGHAIEVRLCAEDARQNFMPQSGRMLLWKEPGGIRVETALESGSDVPPYYDSMIAKVIASGATRDEARRKLKTGLDDLIALGITTNQSFLGRCLDHPVFAEGRATTGFVGAHADQLRGSTDEGQERIAVVAALLLHVSAIDPNYRRQGRTLAHKLSIPLRFDLDGKKTDASLAKAQGGVFRIELDGGSHELFVESIDASSVRFKYFGVVETAYFARNGANLFFNYRGSVSSFADLSHVAVLRGAAAGSDGRLRASMNGRVVSILVKGGDVVAAGQPVVVIEAMKMQHVHVAPVAGTIGKLDLKEGDQVTTGLVIAAISAPQTM